MWLGTTQATEIGTATCYHARESTTHSLSKDCDCWLYQQSLVFRICDNPCPSGCVQLWTLAQAQLPGLSQNLWWCLDINILIHCLKYRFAVICHIILRQGTKKKEKKKINNKGATTFWKYVAIYKLKVQLVIFILRFFNRKKNVLINIHPIKCLTMSSNMMHCHKLRTESFF